LYDPKPQAGENDSQVINMMKTMMADLQSFDKKYSSKLDTFGSRIAEIERVIAPVAPSDGIVTVLPSDVIVPMSSEDTHVHVTS
jgi:hypothetical protein